MVNFNPYEQRKLDSLRPALRQGMDPMIAYEIFSGVEGGALDRMAQNRAMRADMFGQASEALRQNAGAGMKQGAAMDLVQSYQDQMPGLARGKYQGRLEDLAGGLYEGPGNTSSLYQPEPGTGAAAGGLDEQTMNETLMEASLAAEDAARAQIQARSTPTTGGMTAPGMAALGGEEATPGFTTLHDLRSSIMDTLRAQGAPDDFLAIVFDLIAQRFIGAGGDPGEASMNPYGQGVG